MMSAFGMYLLRVSVCLAVFYLLYITLFRNKTFFRTNRFYLLTGLVIAFVIPLIKITLPAQSFNLVLQEAISKPIYQPLQEFSQLSNIEPVDQVFNYRQVVVSIYVSGCFLLLFKLLFSIVSIIRLKRKSEVQSLGSFTLVRSRFAYPFSFFNLIFIPQHEIDPLILEHEKIHVRQRHWVDLILIELATMVLWFNPVIFLYRKALKMQHEYIADACVIKNTGISLEKYLQCMLKQIQFENAAASTSHFYSKSIKKRVMMMTRNKTPFRFMLTYSLFLPVLCVMLCAYCIPSGEKTVTPVFQGIETFATVPGTHTKAIEDRYRPSASPVEPKKKKNILPFGMRINPATNKLQHHSGIDIIMDEGETVMATGDGIVVESVNDPVRGNFVLIKHGGVYATQYSHLRNAVVIIGDKVKKGQTIGYIGSTGLSIKPHLHYEVLKYGHMVDPKDYLPVFDGC
jgi:beta-lactamase regulating signal transducer with metallopeptidase domain